MCQGKGEGNRDRPGPPPFLVSGFHGRGATGVDEDGHAVRDLCEDGQAEHLMPLLIDDDDLGRAEALNLVLSRLLDDDLGGVVDLGVDWHGRCLSAPWGGWVIRGV